MQLKMSPSSASDNVAQTMADHGGLWYIELVKSNLQFIYGKECFLEVVSQVKAPDQWQVSILKTENGVRSVDFFEKGEGLASVLAQLHRKSAQMLSKFIKDNTDNILAIVEEKKLEAGEVALAALGDSLKQEPKKKKNDEYTVFKAASSSREESPGSRLIRPDADSDSSDDFGEATKRNGVPRYWRTSSPSQEIISIKSDSNLRPRSLVCPNYGPASAFYRVSPYGTEPLGGMVDLYGAYKADRHLKAAENGKPKPANWAADLNAPIVSFPVRGPAPAPAPDAVKTQAQHQVKAQAKSEAAPNDSVRMQMETHQRRTPANPRRSLRNVLLTIRWPGYGQTMVADECQLSVRAVQSRVRHMLRTYGAALFDSPKITSAEPFKHEQLVNFTVTVKTMIINDQTVVLGPNFGDDMATVAKGLEDGKMIRIETELAWNGKDMSDSDVL